jgi:hypothetical protein
MSDCFVKKMFQTPFGFTGAIEIHRCDEFLSEFNAS